jgi:hypothetical protein
MVSENNHKLVNLAEQVRETLQSIGSDMIYETNEDTSTNKVTL